MLHCLKNGKFKEFEMCIDQGAEVEYADREFGRTGLHQAAYSGYLTTVELLVRKFGVDADKKDKKGNTALIYASQKGHLDVVIFLVRAAVANAEMANNTGITPLIIACQKGHFQIVDFLVRTVVVDPEKADEDGTTALMIASQNGYIDIVEFLLITAGADQDKTDASGYTSLTIACQQGYLNIVEFLVRNGKADVNKATTKYEFRFKMRGGWTPLMFVSGSPNVNILKFLIQEGNVNIDQADNNGQTALMFACELGNLEAVQILIQAGADVHKTAANNWETSLCFATDNGHVQVVKALIREGNAHIDSPNSLWLALKKSAEHGLQELTEILLFEGRADPNGGTSYEDATSTIYTAIYNGHWKLAVMMMVMGAVMRNGDNICPDFATLLLAARDAVLNARQLRLNEMRFGNLIESLQDLVVQYADSVWDEVEAFWEGGGWADIHLFTRPRPMEGVPYWTYGF
jgi:ankyrin repeat protein